VQTTPGLCTLQKGRNRFPQRLSESVGADLWGRDFVAYETRLNATCRSRGTAKFPSPQLGTRLGDDTPRHCATTSGIAARIAAWTAACSLHWKLG
jgi:hypothetical protein